MARKQRKRATSRAQAEAGASSPGARSSAKRSDQVVT
jgi:hypothetical protein